jgi:hypothetical protein
MTIEGGQAWAFIIAAVLQGLGTLYAAVRSARAQAAAEKTGIKVDEDKAETRAASVKVDDLKSKADDIHSLVNSRSQAQQDRIDELFDALMESAEQRISDQKDAASKVVEATIAATTAVQDTAKQVVETIKSREATP